MHISYKKVLILGSKKVDLFKKILQYSILPTDPITVDEIIHTFTTEDEHYLYARLVGNNIGGALAFSNDGREAIIHYIAIAKKHQRHGLGKALVKLITEQVEITIVKVECELEAATFFEKIGFKLIDKYIDTNKNQKFRFQKKIDRTISF